MSVCPVCRQECQRETLSDCCVCGATGFAYIEEAGQIMLIETNRTLPPAKHISQRVVWTLGETARVKA